MQGLSATELTSIDLADVLHYLRVAGWREVEANDRLAIWAATEQGADSEVLVPLSSHARDLAIRMAEVVRVLSEVEQRSVAEIVEDLRLRSVDVQLIRTLAAGPAGTTPIHEGFLALRGVRELLLAVATSAGSIEQPTVLPSTKPRYAYSFLDQVRLGQTSLGSYVMRIETPLREGTESALSSRDVLTHLYRLTSAAQQSAARSVAAGNTDAFAERVGDGVSANVCQALADIGGRRRNPFELRFTWASLRPVGTSTPTIRVERDQITMLKRAGAYLRDLPLIDEAIVVGRVVELHRTTSNELGKVQIDGIVDVDGRHRSERVIMRLPTREYGIALSAHASQLPLRIAGSLRHTGRQLELSRISSIEFA